LGIFVRATGGLPVERPDGRAQDRGYARGLLWRRAVLEGGPGGAFRGGGFEGEQHVFTLVARELQVRPGTQQDTVPAFEQRRALLGGQLLTEKAQLGREFSPLLHARFRGRAVPQKLTDTAKEGLMLFRIRAMAEPCTPARSFSHRPGS